MTRLIAFLDTPPGKALAWLVLLANAALAWWLALPAAIRAVPVLLGRAG